MLQRGLDHVVEDGRAPRWLAPSRRRSFNGASTTWSRMAEQVLHALEPVLASTDRTARYGAIARTVLPALEPVLASTGPRPRGRGWCAANKGRELLTVLQR